jgi:phospholipid N-methyltransferase
LPEGSSTQGGVKLKTVRISDDALAVLSGCRIEGEKVFITGGQLQRDIYVQVDRVLRDLGGKWNRKHAAHVFSNDPSEQFDEVIRTGEIAPPQKNGFFPTPLELSRYVVERASLAPSHAVLEPSAGTGNLVEAIIGNEPGISSVTAFEIDPARVSTIKNRFPGDGRVDIHCGDFMLSEKPDPGYDRVVMNPPFERLQDVRHVMRAYGQLRNGGILVAIMGGGITFRRESLVAELRSIIDKHGEIENLPDGSFASVGTEVRTVLVTIGK